MDIFLCFLLLTIWEWTHMLALCKYVLMLLLQQSKRMTTTVYNNLQKRFCIYAVTIWKLCFKQCSVTRNHRINFGNPFKNML